MNIRYRITFILVFLSSFSFAQSFKKLLIKEGNIVPYIFNEYNIYLNYDESIIFFNSNKNPNNNSGINDLNDLWIRKKINGYWTFPINIDQVNTPENDLLLGIDKIHLYILRNNKIITYSNSEPYEKISETELIGLDMENKNVSGSIDPLNNLIFLSIESFGSYGVEDIYYSKKIGNSWSRLNNSGSNLNSNFQELSPYLLNNDTLLFISNRLNEGYKIFFSVKEDETYEKWTNPVVVENFNINSSKLSISSNLINSAFYLSESLDSKTNYDLSIYRLIDSEEKLKLEINIIPEIKSGTIKVTSPFINKIDSIKSSKILYQLDNTGEYTFTIKADSYFLKDTVISVEKSKVVNIEMDKIEIGKRKILSKINFERSSTELTDESIPFLKNLLHLFNDSQIKILIEGHTDNSGDYRANVKLSRDRANSIKKFLVENGIQSNRIKTIGLGSSRPRFSNDSESGRQKNRRVEIVIDN